MYVQGMALEVDLTLFTFTPTSLGRVILSKMYYSIERVPLEGLHENGGKRKVTRTK